MVSKTWRIVNLSQNSIFRFDKICLVAGVGVGHLDEGDPSPGIGGRDVDETEMILGTGKENGFDLVSVLLVLNLSYPSLLQQ